MENKKDKIAGSGFLWIALMISIAATAYFGFEYFKVLKQKSICDEPIRETEIITNVFPPEALRAQTLETMSSISLDYSEHILAALELKIAFIEEDSFNAKLERLSQLAVKDKIIQEIITHLRALNEIPRISFINDEYQKVRRKINIASSNSFNRIILKPLGITAQLNGEKAIKAGPPYSILELTSQHLLKRDVVAAYQEISKLEAQYKAYADPWIEEVSKYIKVHNKIESLIKHMMSKEYKNNFVKQNGQPIGERS